MPRPLPASVVRALHHLRWTPADARLVLDAVTASGLTVAEFARQYEVDYQRLNSWRRRLAVPTTAERPLEFVEFHAPPSLASPATARYEIQLPGGEILRVEGALDPEAVGALLGVLRAGGRAC